MGGLVTTPMTRSFAPHRGQRVMSMLKTDLSLAIEVIGQVLITYEQH